MKQLFIFTFLLFLSLSAVQAQLPTKLNQQGFLTDTAGVPLNGIFNMTFNLYTDTTAGTLMFTQTIPGVPVNKGAYSVNLDVSTVSFNQQLWMETQVGSSTLAPRIRLTDAPYAMNSLFLLGPNSEATGTASIAGGSNNRARGAFSVISGGGGATAGDSNSTTGSFATIGGGKGNEASGSSVVGGGQYNDATGNSSTIAGGYMNVASGAQSTIGGGWTNTASGVQATVAGGDGNTASGNKSTVGGGEGNDATVNQSVVAGGGFNEATGTSSFVGGGRYNNARGNYSSVLGGGGASLSDSNSASGTYSAVAGGHANIASGNSSFAAGRYAKAEDDGSFVWNSSTSSFSSSDSLQFLINAANGVGINTGSPESELHIENSTNTAGNSATLELEAAGLNVDADATIIFNIGKDVLVTDQTKWSLGLDDTNNEFVLSKDDSLENNQLFKIASDGTTDIYNSDGISAVQILAEDGSTGAQLKLREKTGNTSITIMAEESVADGGALIKMYDGATHKTIDLDANYNDLGGRIALAESDATQTIILTAQEGSSSGGAQIEMKREDGTTTFVFDAQEGTQGAVLEMYNSTGTKTIDIDADYNGTGESRVTTQVLEITGGSDLAEPFEITGSEIVEAGMVVSIDEIHSGNLKLSDKSYDTKVAGVISGAGGVKPGITLNQREVFVNGRNVAMSGRVYCYVDASTSPIAPGDLLTTSDVPGYAMKAINKEESHGAIIGKAMSSLKEGRGLVLVLVNLQ
ncbi:MAG: hypothetical protein HY960_15030 [Ignavibacteriae bacterium]|nr:hypothetical protein [Ignavibacteriota bacterium]